MRASISSGIGVGRIKQSQTNVSTSRRGLTTNAASPDSQRNVSPKGNLFKKNKESLEGMLVRKLKQKYIDSNPAFALVNNDEGMSTCNLLQNNFLTSQRSSSKRYNPKSSIEYGSVPHRQTSMQNARTRNSQQKQRHTIGNSSNVLPRITNSNLIENEIKISNEQTPKDRFA